MSQCNCFGYSQLIIGASVLATGLAGYYIGAKSSPGPIIIRKDEEEDEDASEDEKIDPDQKDAFANSAEEFKMVLVIRNDLKMGKGKVAAQCAHAAVACYKSTAISNPKALHRWESLGQAKVTLQCDGEEDMKLLQGIAHSLNVTARIIHDAGRTQIAAGSATVLGVGPAPKSVVDQVTGNLKLY